MTAAEPDDDQTLLTPHGHAAGGPEERTQVGPAEPPVRLRPDGPLTVPGYELGREIARGGMGVVYAARELALDRPVAIKVMLPNMLDAEFVREARIAARLPHPGVPPVHALGVLGDGRPFLAMKLVEGETLETLLRGRTDGPADRERFLAVFEQVCQAIGYAHARGVVHRDLKPANVMVGAFGEVQVMDWGLAKVIGADPDAPGGTEGGPAPEDPVATLAGLVKGTPSYMAPEQARSEPVDARADVFALGGVLAVVLTGRPPFVGNSVADTIVRAARADLDGVRSALDGCGADPDLIDLAKRCLHTRPWDRPADGRAVARAVAAYRAAVDDRLRRAERDRAVSAAEAREQRKRRRVWLGGAAVLAVAVTAGLGVVLAVQRRAAADLGAKNAELARTNDELVAAGARTGAALGRADERERLAVDAIGAFCRAVADNRAVKDDPQFADLRGALLRAPDEFCQRLRADLRTDSGAAAGPAVRLARVLLQLGKLRDALGRKDDGLAALTEADALLTRSGGPAAEWQLAAEVLVRKGIDQDALSDYPGALATFDRARVVLDARLRDRPADAAAREHLAQLLWCRALTLGRTEDQAEVLTVAGEAAGNAAEAARLDPTASGAHIVAFDIALLRANEYTKRHRPDDALRATEERGRPWPASGSGPRTPSRCSGARRTCWRSGRRSPNRWGAPPTPGPSCGGRSRSAATCWPGGRRAASTGRLWPLRSSISGPISTGARVRRTRCGRFERPARFMRCRTGPPPRTDRLRSSAGSAARGTWRAWCTTGPAGRPRPSPRSARCPG
ncbi:serine/threonine-protein kinase [Frigoriglobus tundricola]|uniref:Protein kinase domain-containing protein n=1 Tax=Frigoriglobus tundricola TaxID=2774151 RepID=A0A6M5Z451_9BACT|nr:serine/threonine-protein kinase [Frigoriglobus tundricola]QJX00291.1 hypothetical protein FTUN_7916 [Frigoriglobus tundricola]